MSEITLILLKSLIFYLFLLIVAAPKRFYKNTSVLYAGDGNFEITLDNRKLKTPTGTPFVVKSEPLAIAIAAEWDSQKEKIERSRMHLVYKLEFQIM